MQKLTVLAPSSPHFTNNFAVHFFFRFMSENGGIINTLFTMELLSPCIMQGFQQKAKASKPGDTIAINGKAKTHS
jgi:hypothetical protein